MNDEIRYNLLKVLEKKPTISQRQLSQELGISLGKINYCLRALISMGLVKANNFKSNPNKKGYLYILTPKGIDEKSKVTVKFLMRKIDEVEKLKKEIEKLRSEIE